ncbi:hypothetical protein QJS66_05255 [Kocuria rhizophila]|nr:hypothetical protein QJS66_05255 [Kocuria rhizophila]
MVATHGPTTPWPSSPPRARPAVAGGPAETARRAAGHGRGPGPRRDLRGPQHWPSPADRPVLRNAPSPPGGQRWDAWRHGDGAHRAAAALEALLRGRGHEHGRGDDRQRAAHPPAAAAGVARGRAEAPLVHVVVSMGDPHNRRGGAAARGPFERRRGWSRATWPWPRPQRRCAAASSATPWCCWTRTAC